MNTLRLLSVVAGIVIVTTVAGCGGAGTSRSEAGPTLRRTFHGDTKLYRVQVTQYERDGRCIRRKVRFRNHNMYYSNPHVDHVQAIDVGCDATYVSSFERFAVMRSSVQQDRYASSFPFRNRVNEDLWRAYQQTLFKDGQVLRGG